MKVVLCLAILVTPALWADEAADRKAIKATVAALNTLPTPPDLFTADFPNAAELERLRQTPPDSRVIISRDPWGEATWYPVSVGSPELPSRFVTRSVRFINADAAIVGASYRDIPVLFLMKRESTKWRIALLRVSSQRPRF